MTEALGMIECRSFPAVVEAADAAVKAAKSSWCRTKRPARLRHRHRARRRRGGEGGRGRGPDGRGRVGEVVTVHVIARPHVNVDTVMPLGRADEAKGQI